MRTTSTVLCTVILALCIVTPASGQITGPHQPNELNIHAGARFWYGGRFFWGWPNHGLSRYFPSFSHWAGTSLPLGQKYPWKIDGWSWTAMQGSWTSTIWYFDSALHFSLDAPYATDTKINGSKGMGWDYPRMYCLGSVSGALPDFIWTVLLPSIVPLIGGDHKMQFPSSYGGHDQYFNVFAVAAASIITPIPKPWTIWIFGYTGDCTNPITVPSNASIYEYIWMNRPQAVVSQYVMMGGDEFDCTGTAAGNVGNKARNYTILNDTDFGWYWGWGATYEAGHNLAVCDAVTVPVNVPGNYVNPVNPYINLGFDVGAATVTPFVSSGCVTLKFMTLANQAPGMVRAVLASINDWPGALPWNHAVPYGPGGAKRVPHGWDAVTNLIFNLVLVFAHTPSKPFPGYMFSSHAGAVSQGLPFPPDPFAFCLELRYSSLQFAIGPGHPDFLPQPAGPPSASFMTTNF